MRHSGRPLALLAAGALMALAACQAAAADKIPWQSDLKKAQAQATKQKKMLMVDFTADW